MKTCPKCGSDGPFNRNKREKDGLSYYCTLCMRIADRESYQRHKGNRNAKSKRWQQENKERKRATKKAWEKANPDKVRAMKQRPQHKAVQNASARKRYAKDPTSKLASMKKWRHDHPETAGAIDKTKRARRRGANGSASAEQIAGRVEVYSGLCAYCGTRPYNHIDHAVAIANGGSSWPANLRPACAGCNLRKGVDTWRLGKPVRDQASRERDRRDRFEWLDRTDPYGTPERSQKEALPRTCNTGGYFFCNATLRADGYCPNGCNADDYEEAA